jgi:hypothetical protein
MMGKIRCLAITAFAGFAAGSLSPAAAQQQATVQLAVDAQRPIGKLKPLSGVNGAPDLTFLPAALRKTPFGDLRDASAAYRAAGVTLVRTHDAQGVGDIDPHLAPGAAPPAAPHGTPPAVARAMDLNVIFPDPAADPNDPASYNFGPTDRLVESIRAIGADVLFRLGREAMGSAPPPTDFPRYAAIIRHIVLHYNKGWAHGFTNQVRYWEVWNEPDLGHIWWQGTPEQYFAFYGAAAHAVKAADPDAEVGGPTIAMVNGPSPYKQDFLAYVRAHRLPLDFFSWHWYSTDADDPYDFVRIGKRIRALLDRNGFTATQSFLDEWNLDFRHVATTPPMQQAAFVASARLYMQDGAIDRDAFYRADSAFSPDGKPTKLGEALIAIDRLARTPIRLAVSGGDTDGLAIVAGRSRDGRTIQVLVSDYCIPADERGPRPNGDVLHEHGLFDMQLLPRRAMTYAPHDRFRLTVSGLPDGEHWRVEHHRVSANRDFSAIDTTEVAGSTATLTGPATAPAIDLFVLTRH